MSSLSSIPCVVEKCELASLALCQCCKKDLCIDHLNEHANQRNGKLLPFIDKINVLLNRFTDFYDGDRSNRKQLDQWRDEAFQVIENFYEKKRREHSGEPTDQQREQLNEIHQKLKDLIRKKGGTQQDFDRFSTEMHSIEQYLDKLQQTKLTLPSLNIDDHCLLPPPLPETTTMTASATTQTDPVEATPTKSSEPSDNSSQKSVDKKKSSKKRKKSSRHSDDASSDRSSHRRSRSPRRHSERSKKRRDRSVDSTSSTSSNHQKGNCDDCHDCRFYQDRFGPGFMDSFGPCSCECHKWAYSQMKT